jgi:transposase
MWLGGAARGDHARPSRRRGSVRGASGDGPLNERRREALSESRTYRKFSARQKTELVLASLRGPKTITELCREHDISDSLLRKWREQFLAAGAERLSGRAERTETDELRRQVARLERALGGKTMEVEIAGELLRGWE